MRRWFLGRWRVLAWAVVGLGCGLIVAALLSVPVIVSQIRSTQVDRTSQNEANDQTLALIKDCTDPKGECFKKAQARTAKAVGDINRVIILAAACASKPYEQTVEQVAACVTRRLNDPQALS